MRASGFSLKGGAQCAFDGGRLTLSVANQFYQLYSWSGYTSEEEWLERPTEKPGNVQGDVSRALFNHLEFRVDCRLWHRLSASLAMNWFHRFTYYDRWMDFPEENYSVYDYLVDSDQWDLRLMVRYGF